MATLWMSPFILMCVFRTLSLQETSPQENTYKKLVVKDIGYCLSNINEKFEDAEGNCNSIGTTLALFDDNQEFSNVYNQTNEIGGEVWIQINYHPLNSTLWWRNEIIQSNLMAKGEYDSSCSNINGNQCCAKVRFGPTGSTGNNGVIIDRKCSEKKRVLCKASTIVMHNVLNCIPDCTNTKAMLCNCSAGYLFNATTQKCEISNKSLTSDLNCNISDFCSSSPCQHLCFNTSSYFICKCYAGYFLLADGVHCSLIDHCNRSACLKDCSSANNSSVCNDQCPSSEKPCDTICHNTNDSYICSCHPGYFLNLTDNKTCHDIDECSLNSSLCEVFCNNTPGSYVCSCREGDYLSENRRTCNKRDIQYQCPCKCSNSTKRKLVTSQQLHELLETLLQELQVEKANLLSTQLLHTCRADDRSSSNAIGSFGIVFLTFIFVSIVIVDLMKLLRHVIDNAHIPVHNQM